MPALVGTVSLALALALALYGGIAAIVGVKTGRPRVIESARTAAFSLFALVVVANLAMLAALLSDDFTLRYVATNSSTSTPTFFKVLALWSADEGSLLLWNLVLGGYLAAVAFRFRRRRPEAFPWALAVLDQHRVRVERAVGAERALEHHPHTGLEQRRGPPRVDHRHPGRAVGDHEVHTAANVADGAGDHLAAQAQALTLRRLLLEQLGGGHEVYEAPRQGSGADPGEAADDQYEEHDDADAHGESLRGSLAFRRGRT